MEKEMKKLLLVAVSVGVFLLVTITVAIIVITPKAHTLDSTFSSSVPYTHGRAQDGSSQSAVINNSQEVIFNIDKVDKEIDIIAAVDSNNGDSLTIQIPMPSITAAPDAELQTAEPAAPVRAAPATPAQTAKPAQTAASTPAASTRTTTPAARTTTPARTATVNDYWVQTGAFSSMVRAEDAKETLSSKGLTSIIETRIVNGQNFFRVRLGPYTSENEAKHWLEIVKLIDGFHDSQVRQTIRQQL